jgi:hypothetical protein
MLRISAYACAFGLLLSVGCESSRATIPAPPTHGRFAIHEWGLFAVSTAQPSRASAATQTPNAVLRTERVNDGFVGGLGGMGPASGLKPVFYVHLDEGTNNARFDLDLGVPSSTLVERWPIGGALDGDAQRTRAGWQGVVARRGPCVGATPPPTWESPLCATRDHFCEAAEIPRYAGDRASCLTVGEEKSEVLFYRAESISTAPLPLRLEHDGTAWKVARTGNAATDGPIFYIEASAPGATPSIRQLGTTHIGVPLSAETGVSLTPADVRIALLAEATRRGLTRDEADAFVDAWSPAFFDRCLRTGPEASGEVPASLAQAGRSLLYFAPEAAVDAMLPLTTTPRARSVARVFLVRFVDEATRFAQTSPSPSDHIGHGSFAPCTGRCPRVTLRYATVSRGLDAGVVRRIVRRNFGQLTFCYEQALRTVPALQREVSLALAVRPDGSVRESMSRFSYVEHAALDRCFEGVGRRLSFPALEGAADARVELSFMLTRAEGRTR